MSRWLVDAGPMVAALNASDPAHRAVVRALGGFTGSLWTTGSAVTEAMHFLRRAPLGPRRLAELVDATSISIREVTSPAALLAATTLMERYADTPMDFADATLVLLADEIAERRILTLDRRGFSTFRTTRKEPFELVLDVF
jgi:uncharacterized protein